MKKTIMTFLLAIIVLPAVTGDTENRSVIASTGWIAAFVRTAGVDDVTVLAPYELKHPPEYELKPSDITRVAAAGFIVYAGYERMAAKLKETAAPDAVLIAITTQNDPESIRTGVRKLAAHFDTGKRAEENLKALDTFFLEWKKELDRDGLLKSTVICHTFQEPLVSALDFTIAGTFGPSPPEAKQIASLVLLNTVRIIDNIHNPVAAAISSSIRNSRTAILVNFPRDRTMTDILSILRYNREILGKAFGTDR